MSLLVYLHLPLQLYLYLRALPTSSSQIFRKKLVGSLLKGGEYESGNSYKNMKYSHSTAAPLWESFQGYFCPNGQFNLSTWANFTDWHTCYVRTMQTNLDDSLTKCFDSLAGQKWKLFANHKAVWDILAEAIAVTWIFSWSWMPSSSKVSFVHKSLIRPWRRPWPTWPPPCPPSSSQFSSCPSSQRRSLVCQGLPHSCQGPVPVPCNLKHIIQFLVVIVPISSKYLQKKIIRSHFLMRSETSKP